MTYALAYVVITTYLCNVIRNKMSNKLKTKDYGKP